MDVVEHYNSYKSDLNPRPRHQASWRPAPPPPLCPGPGGGSASAGAAPPSPGAGRRDPPARCSAGARQPSTGPTTLYVILLYSDISYKILQLRISGPFLLFPLSTPTFSGSLSANYEVSWNEAPSMIECKISTTDFLHNRLHNHPGSRALVASLLSHGPGDHTAIVTSSPSFTTVQLGCNITGLTLHDLRCSSEISACILL